MPPSFSAEQKETVLLLGDDPVLAHEYFFGQNHTEATPAFHEEMIEDWHSDEPNVGAMAFRGAAKSTRAEEAIAISIWFERARNIVVLGDSEARAIDRIRAIKNIILNNERGQRLFNVGMGDIWTETKVTFSNGIILQGYGRGQSLRGVKHLDNRPDLIFLDDIEDEESVKTPEGRAKTMTWFTKTVIPAKTPNGKMRMAATPLHPNALAPTLAAAKDHWLFKKYPIIYKDELDNWKATWPERYSVAWAEHKKAELNALGEGDTFIQEYMVQATNPATQVFTPDLIRVVPQVRSWHAVYAMYDPARTTHKKSATTGKAVWSWIGRKMVIWDAFARKLMPDEIVQDIFECEERFSPVAIGVEETGLNEWLRQPLRTEQVQRGVTLPLRALNAPKGKMDFIKGLQPYFKAGEVEFACDLPELRDQLLGFPTGDIDAPNALAYALRMKLGAPIYDSFRAEHMCVELRPTPRSPLWLAVNSDGRCTTAAMCQINQGQLTIFSDWMREGDPGQVLGDILMEAAMETPDGRADHGLKLPTTASRMSLRLIAPRPHFDLYSPIGLRAAVKKIPADLNKGGDIAQGRAELRRLFERVVHGQPAVRIDTRATWTARALAGGFCRTAEMVEPDANAYRVMMEGVESFAAMLRGASVQDDSVGNFDYTSSGQRFRSARAR